MLGIKAVWFSGSHSRDTIFSLSSPLDSTRLVGNFSGGL